MHSSVAHPNTKWRRTTYSIETTPNQLLSFHMDYSETQIELDLKQLQLPSTQYHLFMSVRLFLFVWLLVFLIPFVSYKRRGDPFLWRRRFSSMVSPRVSEFPHENPILIEAYSTRNPVSDSSFTQVEMACAYSVSNSGRIHTTEGGRLFLL